MSKEDRSNLLLRDFEPSIVRLKRKLRLILNKNLRQDKISNENITLVEFILYSIFLIIVIIMCTMNYISQDLFYADKCIRRLLINKFELNKVKTIDTFWKYIDRFNNELYTNVIQLKQITNNTKEQFTHQILFSNENFILGTPRLRQIRIDDTYCHIMKDLSVRKINCYIPYDKSKEYRDKFTSITGAQYIYTSSKTTSALKLTNIYGPYDTGGFIYHFDSIKQLNDEAMESLKTNAWLDLSTRAIFLEFIYFNPNTEQITSINILFEFLTTGTIETKDFFYTIPINSFFFGRKKLLGIFHILFLLYYIIYSFYYVGKIAEYRLWFIMSSYWNLYDLSLLILFSISFYFDIKYLVYISQTLNCLSTPKNDIFKELISFIETQINRMDLQAYIIAASLIRLLRFLPHFSYLISNLLNVFYKSIRNSIGFLLLFILIFLSFVVFATFHYGNELYEFHTFALTSYTLIRCTLGQFEYDRAYRVSPTWTPIFYMLYVCIIFFILLNLLIAVINETYVLSKEEQKQIEDDLQEENISHRNYSKQPKFIQQITSFLKKSIDNDDDKISLEEKQILIIEKLKKILVNDGYNKDMIEKFFESNNDDDRFLLEIEQNQIIKILYNEFKIFNNQYEKLAQDWQKTVRNARQLILVNTIDIEQVLIMKNNLDILDQRLKKFENLIPKILENIHELYVNHFFQ
ncbi:unnamed protein product [Adineta steineri]|uniref:Uncharacterized protein n=2 Tax=Adineta steineri TaxID=433720 RepID=A0A818NV97_9BILA|nr:unnamed protein product [Adineta steineri]